MGVALGGSVLILAIGACFSPELREGLGCSESGDCPPGQSCSLGICRASVDLGFEIDAAVIDAAVIDAADDLAVPDADTSCPGGTVPCGGECLSECTIEFTQAGEDTYVPEEGCTYVQIHAWGAGGGNGWGNANAGAGGYALMERFVTSLDSFSVAVGAPGASATAATLGTGGAPGGGNGGGGSDDPGGGGGGYSAVFLGAADVANAVVVAGGGAGSGGGSGNNPRAGAGGGLDGQSGSGSGIGGGQASGFGQLLGGAGGAGNDGGGGGGAGFYGGFGGGSANSDAQGGGGGSGYVGAAAISDLQAGNRALPGNAASPLRGDAGNPTVAGKVIVVCLPPPI